MLHAAGVDEPDLVEEMENVTESDVHELVNAYRRAYTQGRDQLGDKSIQFRILQAILRASAQNTHDWIELNAVSTPASREELQSYAATLAKGDIIGTTARKLTPTAALKTAIRVAQSAALHHVMIGIIALLIASGIVSSRATGRLLLVGLLGGGAIAGTIFWGLRGLARSAPQAGSAAVTAIKSANRLSQPAQSIFESQTTPTLTRFYGRFNKPAPGTPMVAWVNRTATGTLILMYLILALVAVFFMVGFMHSIAAELGNDCNFTPTTCHPIHLH